jgi:hypothetical protein
MQSNNASQRHYGFLNTGWKHASRSPMPPMTNRNTNRKHATNKQAHVD